MEGCPEIDPEWGWVWEAWVELHRLRPAGWGHTPIPFTEMLAWLDIHRIDDAGVRGDFCTLIVALESVAMDERARQAKDRETERLGQNGATGGAQEPEKGPSKRLGAKSDGQALGSG